MRRLLLTLCLLVTANLAVAADLAKLREPHPNLTILADDTLMLPLAQLSRAYAKESGTPLTIVQRSTGDAEGQIQQGLEAHILITAHRHLIDTLSAQGLVDVFGTRAVARTQLALIAPLELSKQGQFARHISFAALLYATPSLPIYMLPETTDEGARAKALMKGAEFSHAIEERAVVVNSREELLDFIREGKGLGLLLAADAINEPDVTIISVLPESVSAPVIYEAVVLASESMKDAKRFTNFLQGKTAGEILSHFGFQSPDAR